ncbi:MAG: sensor histidine kinase [Chitinophagaceae bacterium]|nr:MAG: sensor histidine kinase [Chitinophagaceae bacterium]
MLEIIIFGTGMLLLIGGFVIYFLLLYNARQKKNREERKTMRENFQQELLRTQLEIQEQTLQHVGLEIHDNIGQTLSLAKLHLNTVPAGEQSEKVTDTKQLVAKAITDLRQLSKGLNAEALLADGLLKAAERELALIAKAKVFETALEVTGTPRRLLPQSELILFRIVQEGLNNSIKHSGARRLELRFHFGEDELRIALQDDGHGFAGGSNGDGQGLRNIRNRAALIGARCDIDGTKGTTILLTLSKQNYVD